MQTKLTLRLDEELVRRAKAYSKRTGKSVSHLVADYFSLLEASERSVTPLTPIVRSLKGVLRGASVSEEDYRGYLEEKHR